MRRLLAGILLLAAISAGVLGGLTSLPMHGEDSMLRGVRETTCILSLGLAMVFAYLSAVAGTEREER